MEIYIEDFIIISYALFLIFFDILTLHYYYYTNYYTHKYKIKKLECFVAVLLQILYISSVVPKNRHGLSCPVSDMDEVNNYHEFVTKTGDAVQGLFPFLPVPCRRILLAVRQSGRKGRSRKPAA